MILLDGKFLSNSILSSLRSTIDDLQSKPYLHVILVGEDPSSVKYVSLKEAKCKEIGVKFKLHHLPKDSTETDLIKIMNDLNNDDSVTGFFIQLPLPPHLSKDKILPLISPKKDVDGLTPNSNFLPAVVVGIMSLLQHYQICFNDKNVVILNDSELIGQPLKRELQEEQAHVTLVNKNTPNIPQLTRDADILISATGVKNLVTADMVKQGAVVVDVANGDVDFANVSPKTSYITPTFGGIGPMTIACLLQNTYHAFLRK